MLNGNGVMLSQTDYAPFGNELWQGGNATERRSWIGKEQDNESELGDFGVRKYDEDIGRFLSCDALWEEYRNRSPYIYSNNDPVNILDITGLGDKDTKKDVVTVKVSTVNVQAGTSSQGVQIKQTTEVVNTKNKKNQQNNGVSSVKQNAQVQANVKQYVVGVKASSDGSGSVYGGVGARVDAGAIVTGASAQAKVVVAVGVDDKGEFTGGAYIDASVSYKPLTKPGAEVKIEVDLIQASINAVNSTIDASKVMGMKIWSRVYPCFTIPGIPY